MATLNIQISLDNAIFSDGYLAREYELEKLLAHISEQIFSGDTERKVIDSNGNKVGFFNISEG